MLTTANQKPISVGILEISSQNKAVLEFFFANSGKKMFKEVSLEKAATFIIDYDSLGAKSSWDTTYNETQKPGIIISIKEVDLPNCIWLAKPLTVQALTEAGVSIREMIIQGEEETEQLFSAPEISASIQKTQEIEAFVADLSDNEENTNKKLEAKSKPIEEAITLEPFNKSNAELTTVTKEPMVDRTDKADNNEIDIIDFELGAAPPEKLNPITSDITDDGLSLNLQDHETDIETPDDLDNGTLFSPVDNSVESTTNLKDEVDKQVSKILPKPKKQTKKTSEDELQSLLEEIRQEADESNKKDNPEREKPEGQPTVAEERWMLTCGENDDIEEIKDLCVLTPSNHMIATLLEIIEKANGSKKVLRLKYKKVIIVIEPTTDRIYCEPSIYSKEYADICYETASKDDINIHELDASEMRLYRKKMRTDKERTHTFEAFIWTTSLLTSRGRLPVNTDFSSNIGLKYWPNLTRVEKIPHMMQIAAILHKKSTSLQKASLELGISQKYIFAFYNAALSLDIIKNTSNNDSSTAIDEETIKNKGFFSRLLKRLSS